MRQNILQSASSENQRNHEDAQRSYQFFQINNSKLPTPNSQLINDDYLYDEVPIKDIQAGDEILSLNEKTGQLVYQPVIALIDMGVKPIYKLTTATGKTIRTTGNHPYLVRISPLSVHFVSQFYTGDIKNSFLTEEFNPQFPYSKTVRCWRHIHQWFSKYKRILIREKICKFLSHPLLPFLVKPLEFSFGFWGQSKFMSHGYREYSLPALISRSASWYSRLISSLYSLLNGQRSSSLSMSFPNETDSYDSSESVSNNFSSVLHTNSQNAIKSKRNQAGLPSRSKPATARNLLGSFASLGTTREKCSTLRPEDVNDFVDFFAIQNYCITPVSNVKQGQQDSLTATITKGKWMRISYLKEGMEIAIASNDGKIALWDRIVKIEHLPQEQVYDIEIEGTHNFIGNEIIAHNTYLQSTATTGTSLNLDANSLTTGTGLDISSPSTAGGLSGSSKLLNIARLGANANASHTAYGLYSAITNTGTTSTNIAGYFSASGGTNNYGLIVDSGSVGIGTTAPAATLHVNGDMAMVSDNQLYLESTAAAVGDSYLQYFSSDGTGRIGVFEDGTESLTIKAGNIGIGTTGPISTLHIGGGSGNKLTP